MTALTIMGPGNRSKATLAARDNSLEVEVRFWRHAGGERRQQNIALLDPCEVPGIWAQTGPQKVFGLPWHRVVNLVHDALWKGRADDPARSHI